MSEANEFIRLPKLVGATEHWEFSSGKTILEAIENSGTFSITKTSDGRFDVSEHCESYFGVILTKEQMLQLAAEIVAMAECE